MNSNSLVLTAAACRVSGKVKKEIEDYVRTPLKLHSLYTLQAQRRLGASIISDTHEVAISATWMT